MLNECADGGRRYRHTCRYGVAVDGPHSRWAECTETSTAIARRLELAVSMAASAFRSCDLIHVHAGSRANQLRQMLAWNMTRVVSGSPRNRLFRVQDWVRIASHPCPTPGGMCAGHPETAGPPIVESPDPVLYAFRPNEGAVATSQLAQRLGFDVRRDPRAHRDVKRRMRSLERVGLVSASGVWGWVLTAKGQRVAGIQPSTVDILKWREER